MMQKSKKNNEMITEGNISENVKIKFRATYEQAFLQKNNMRKRGDKSIYVSSVNHKRLSHIIHVIGNGKTPLYAYLDNILEHHFEMFEKTITDDFNEKSKTIF